MVYMVRCPVCRAGATCRCRDLERGSLRRFPHWRRLAAALARILLVSAGEDPVQFALAVEDADPGTSARAYQARGTGHTATLSDVDELVAYGSVQHLLDLAGSVLDEFDQRTLDLSLQCERIQALSAEIEQAPVSDLAA